MSTKSDERLNAALQVLGADNLQAAVDEVPLLERNALLAHVARLTQDRDDARAALALCAARESAEATRADKAEAAAQAWREDYDAQIDGAKRIREEFGAQAGETFAGFVGRLRRERDALAAKVREQAAALTRARAALDEAFHIVHEEDTEMGDEMEFASNEITAALGDTDELDAADAAVKAAREAPVTGLCGAGTPGDGGTCDECGRPCGLLADHGFDCSCALPDCLDVRDASDSAESARAVAATPDRSTPVDAPAEAPFGGHVAPAPGWRSECPDCQALAPPERPTCEWCRGPLDETKAGCHGFLCKLCGNGLPDDAEGHGLGECVAICPACDGSGKISVDAHTGAVIEDEASDCKACLGTGWVPFMTDAPAAPPERVPPLCGGLTAPDPMFVRIDAKPYEPRHDKSCDTLVLGPDLNPSTKPCNCRCRHCGRLRRESLCIGGYCNEGARQSERMPTPEEAEALALNHVNDCACDANGVDSDCVRAARESTVTVPLTLEGLNGFPLPQGGHIVVLGLPSLKCPDCGDNGISRPCCPAWASKHAAEWAAKYASERAPTRDEWRDRALAAEAEVSRVRAALERATRPLTDAERGISYHLRGWSGGVNALLAARRAEAMGGGK